MNWSLIILGLVALSSVAIADNSYLIFAPKLFKVGWENQLSVFIASAPQPVEVKYILTVGPKRVEGKITVNAGETRNATLALPSDFPVGPGELIMVATGGLRFEERRDLIVYDNRHVILVQTSASTYRPGDMMDIRVVVTTDELIPVEKGEVLIEIYDAALKLIGRFPQMLIKSGITETVRYPISEHNNIGTWLVSATVGNTTSSLEVLVAEPITKSFDLKAIFQRFILRTEKSLRGVIEIDSDNNEPIFGRAFIAVGALTEADVERMKTEKPSEKPEKEGEEMWRKWKSQEMDVAGRIEFNYDILSMFNIDVTKVLALQVYIRVEDLVSGQERFIQHIIPIFTRDVVYDIRPLEFTAGMENEFQVIAKRPDGKPAKMEDMIITITMLMGDDKGKIKEEKSIEVNKFYTRGRNDIGFFNVQIPETCIGVLMTITPLGEDGKVRGYRTHAVPLMPTPRREVPNAKLTIELLPSMMAPVGNDPKAPLVSSQVSAVGRTSNFYIQLLPTKPVEKFEPLPMSYILMTNGRITGSGEFMIKPSMECQSKATRSIEVDEVRPPVCVFNGTLPIAMTRAMVPYSTLLVYTFQPSFGFNVAESYRFSVAGLFKDALTLNATVVPYSTVNRGPEQESEELDVSSEEFDGKPIEISSKAQDKNRVQLSFTGTPEALVGLNVIEYDGVMQGLSSEITKERLLNYLTSYEQVPIVGMPTVSPTVEDKSGKVMQTRGVVSEDLEEKNIEREAMGFKLRYPLEKMVFGVNSNGNNKPIESDDVYAASNMDRFYADEGTRERSAASHYRRKSLKSMNQYDVTVSDNDYVVATSYPLVFVAEARAEAERLAEEEKETSYDEEDRANGMGSPSHGSPAWFEKLHSRLSEISQEAFIFMQSGLNVISDFQTLRLPADMKRVNLTTLFDRYRKQSNIFDDETFSDRDEARVVLEQYLLESDMSMVPSPILLEEQARLGYYRSVFFNTSRIGAQGKGEVILPRTKPYSTWLATGFSLHSKTGLAIAQPIRLPTNQGLFVLGSFVDQMRVDERALLTYGINNYLGKDLTNVILRIHGSMDFDLMDGDRVVATAGKDYTLTIPSLKIFAVETRNITVVPKRTGVTKIVIEVESEFGGDYEVLTFYVRESGIKHEKRSMRLIELTAEKKTVGPIVFKVDDVPSLRSVRFMVSGTGLDRLIDRYALETSHLLGIDRAIIRLWRSLGLRRYLNETAQADSYLDETAESNVTMAYQKLQLYSTYNGSYSFISDEGLEQSSLYLTTLSFGAMISPFMTVRDNVTLNRTLTWILAHQQQDGSFDDQGPCYHFRFCTGEYRRDGLTALFYFAMTRDNVSEFLPEFIRKRLFEGEQSPMMRAHRYLESRYEAVKSCMLTTALFELALSQSKLTTPVLREMIMKNLRSRKLTVVPEDGSKFFQYNMERVTYDDQLLVNAIMLSTYANFGDYETASYIARWAVQQFEKYPYHDTVLDSIFGTEAWLRMDYLYRRAYPTDKFSVIVDVTADNGEKQQFKIDQSNIDLSQKFRFTLPVKQISYTVSGFGAVGVEIRQVFYEKEQKRDLPSPFTLTNDFTPAPWFSEIQVKTCMTYTPTKKELEKVKESFNRTIVVEYELPSGTRINLRQIGFALSRIENMMYFTFDERARTLNFFINMPQTSYGKPICFAWGLERLSYLMSWNSVQVHAYDYLQQDTELQRLFPTQFQPSVAGYAFIDAFHKARPSLEQLVASRKQMASKQS